MGAEADPSVSYSMKKRKTKEAGDEGYDPFDFDGDSDKAPTLRRRPPTKPSRTAEVDDGETEAATAAITGDEEVTISEERLQIFRSTLHAVFSEKHAQSLALTEVTSRLSKDYPDAPYSTSEVEQALARMTEDNQGMLSDGTLFIV